MIGRQFSLRKVIAISLPTALSIFAALSLVVASGLFAPGNSEARDNRTWFVCPFRSYQYSCHFYGAVGIQEAINRSSSGDRIVLRHGSYTFPHSLSQSYVDTYRNRPEGSRHFTIPTPLVLANKRITLEGDPHEPTIIDFGGAQYGLVVANAGGSTIRYLQFSGIRSAQDSTQPEGGAIIIRSHQRQDPVRIIGVRIKNDNAWTKRRETKPWAHGVVVKDYGSAEIHNSLLIQNTGSGILGFDSSSIRVFNSLLLGNNDGAQSSNNGELFITNSVIANNTARNSREATPSGFICGEQAHCTVQYTILFNNKNGDTHFWNGGSLTLGTGLYYQRPPFTYRSRANKQLWKQYDLGTFVNPGDPRIMSPDGTRSWIGLFSGKYACAVDDHNPGCERLRVPQPPETRPTPLPTYTPKPPRPQPPTPTIPSYSKTVWNVCQSGCPYPGGEGLEQAWSAASNYDVIRLEPGRYVIETPELGSFANFHLVRRPNQLFVLARKAVFLQSTKDNQVFVTDKEGTRLTLVVRGQ